MTDEPDPSRKALEALSVGELAEIALQLQGQVDHLVEVDERRRARVGRLESDRAALRRRLDDAEARSIIQHARRRNTRRGKQAPPTVPERTALDVTIPDGVGTIPELELPASTPSRPWLRVATILDEFSSASFGPEFDAVALSAARWQHQLEERPVDLLFVESAFRGTDGSWGSRVARIGRTSDELVALVRWCQKHDIPTVFWNKEDPVNFGWFVASAALFDHVFTVDGETIERYERVLGHERIGVLPFAAQPAFHHPPADASRAGTIAFAGSYYARKHPERKLQMKYLLEPARHHGLHIFDRMGGSRDPRFAWPERFRTHIVGQLTYPQMLEAYRRYRIFINVNTVTDSPTMCARRVFELAACGAAIVSGPSRAIEEMVPPGAVAVVRDDEQAAGAYAELLGDEQRWGAMTERARAWVLDGHTYGHRVASILAAAEIPDRGATPGPSH